MRDDVVLFNPETDEVSEIFRVMPEGNHQARIVGVTILDWKKSRQGEDYRQLRLQWSGEAGQIRQDLIFDHRGSRERADQALDVTRQAIGRIAKAVGFQGSVSLGKLMEQLGNKPVWIGVRMDGKYGRVKYHASALEDLPPVEASSSGQGGQVKASSAQSGYEAELNRLFSEGKL